MMTLYTSIVRPKLEYCIHSVEFIFAKIIVLLENVQRLAT